MAFWGVEVPAGKSVKVTPEEDFIIHLSQVSLSVSKSGAEQVPLYVECGGQKIVMALLSHKKCPHVALDLMFEKEFELSHGWEGGSVYFSGYRNELPFEEDAFDDHEDCPSCDESEDEEIAAAEEAKLEEAITARYCKNNDAKPNGKAAELMEESDDDSGEMDSDDSESDDEDVSSDEEDDATPAKAEVTKDAGKKRPAESETKTPQAKKAKAATPVKTDGKKGAKTATPAKPAGKAAAQTPKSGGVKCNSCSKTFKNDAALQSHSKAKHSAK